MHYCRYFKADYSLIGDAGTVAAVIDPEGATTARGSMRVELTGEATRGATVFDRRRWRQREAGEGWADIDVITKVDAPRYRRLMAAALDAEELLAA